MVFRNFHTQVILRVLLLFLTLTTLIYLAMETNLYATSLLMALIAAYQIWSLVNYVDRTNLDLSRFFDSVRYSDFLQINTHGQLGGSFADLSRAMNQVTSAFQSARAEKEEHYRYLQTIIQHVGIGLLAYNSAGEVELLNPAARRLLQRPQLRDIGSLRAFSEELVKTLETIQPGQRALVKLQTDYESLQLSIHATRIRLGQKQLTLVSLQNIGSELAEQEMVAWQNLIRVLTHEIMNSMTPIASLAGSVNDRFRSRTSANERGFAEDDQEISEALITIERRSEGLMHFVESYRDLTRIPQPDVRVVPVRDLLARVEHLLESNLRRQGVVLKVVIEPVDLTLACDPDLIEQVLINLINNALHAVQGVAEPKLAIHSRLNRNGKVVIEIEDNGYGIVPGAIDQIFIPFFTTKKGGTGIGLALSQQIMRLHNAQIGVRSTPNERTVFTLTF